ncbi:DUF4062 domain-containing protein [Mesorhizobium sp. B2-7-1]|uniref:DUF4062 domain-containing protein n=1 Tax=Mesorhizobium sp. B2-7-1 TaxID=2589909 RepID=UPI001AEF1D1A|nr:DUF4062 domain-containing protein [Mesorhizobium sp. B2-7-1]
MLRVPQLHHGAERHLREVRHVRIDERVQLRSFAKPLLRTKLVLRLERRTLDCIPSGIEFFPASDKDTFEFIKTVIDICDYYIMTVSGKYGSVASDGGI